MGREARLAQDQAGSDETLCMESQLSLVPPGRLGALLAQQRVEKGLSRHNLAEQSTNLGLGFDSDHLFEIEHGFVTLTDSELSRALALYGVKSGGLLQDRARLVLDLNEGTMWAGDHVEKLGRKRNQTDIFERYISLLYVMRNEQPGKRLTLRDEDLKVLSGTFGRDTDAIHDELLGLMLSQRTVSWVRRLSQKVRVPTAGILVGLTAAGSLVITNNILSDASSASTVAGPRPSGTTAASALVVPGADSTVSTQNTFASEIAAATHYAIPVSTAAALDDNTEQDSQETELGADADHGHLESDETVHEISDDTSPPTATIEGESVVLLTPAEIGAAAEDLIQYPFKQVLGDSWTFQYLGDRAGYRGLTDPTNRTISIYLNPGDTPEMVAEILAHEIGHALDVTFLTGDQRQSWMNERGIDQWWISSGMTDFKVGAGDYAEAFAAATTGSASASHHGHFTEAELAMALSFLE